jgi:hypothetical protein
MIYYNINLLLFPNILLLCLLHAVKIYYVKFNGILFSHKWFERNYLCYSWRWFISVSTGVHEGQGYAVSVRVFSIKKWSHTGKVCL